MDLHVLLVEDNEQERKQLERDIPHIFLTHGIKVVIDSKPSFEEGMDAIKNPHLRYDLVISDTYRGNHKNKDIAVFESIEEHRKGKFCPIIVCSSGECPADFKETAFVKWVDKANPSNLDNSINYVLQLGIPQIAKKIHQEIDRSAGNFLWGFLESNWTELNQELDLTAEILERIIRRRAALKISDLHAENYAALETRYGLEYYIYPSLDHDFYSLGEIVRSKTNNLDIRVIMTPHCHLFTQPGKPAPRAEFVLTIKTVLAKDILKSKMNNLTSLTEPKKDKKLRGLANSPAQTETPPEGRHWFLPGFLKIPHSFCDFLQIESIPYSDLDEKYESLGTLSAPYAEALQQCFASFYSAVGIPVINTASISNLIDKTNN